MSNSVAQELFNTLQTKQRANDFLRLFDQIEGLSHHVGVFKIEDVLSLVYGDSKPDWVINFLNNMPNLMFGSISTADINLLKEIRDMVERATVVKIEINFSPSLEFIDNVIKKLRGKYDGMNFIVDVITNEILESGAMFYIDGNVIDLTVRNKVTSYLTTQDVINRYL